MQETEPPVGAVHEVPQAPQFVTVVVLVSQPLVGLPSQLPKPAEHTGAQLPPLQLVELAPAVEHTVPQAPQLLGSEPSARQVPEQVV